MPHDNQVKLLEMVMVPNPTGCEDYEIKPHTISKTSGFSLMRYLPFKRKFPTGRMGEIMKPIEGNSKTSKYSQPT